jgi:hypothetical protein
LSKRPGVRDNGEQSPDAALMKQPSQTPDFSRPKYGFNTTVETLNGRLAMIGFVLAIAIEFLTGKGVLHWLGLVG